MLDLVHKLELIHNLDLIHMLDLIHNLHNLDLGHMQDLIHGRFVGTFPCWGSVTFWYGSGSGSWDPYL
jgi:hypothetical protein